MKTDSNLPQHVYAIFDMAGEEDDYKSFSYLTRLDESLGGRVKIEGRILGRYRGPRLRKPGLSVRAFRTADDLLSRRALAFFRAAWRRIQSARGRYWFSSLGAKHLQALKWMQTWNQPDAKAVFFVRDPEAGLKLVELAFLYATIPPKGMVVVLLCAESSQTSHAKKLRPLEKWGVRILRDGSSYSSASDSSIQHIPSLHFDSVQEMPLHSSSLRNVDWSEELSRANLIQQSPEKVLFVRPDWMKCGSATTFGKLGKLFQDRGAILIDVALQPYKVPYDGITIQHKLAEVKNDIAPSFHFNLRRGSRPHALLAIGKRYLRTRPKTVAGFMPIFYQQCVTPALVRKLIADARIDYLYVNHYFSLPVAKHLRSDRPVFLDTHDIQSLNFVSHDYHRHIRMRAAPFSACLDEELRFIDQADRVTMVSRDEIDLISKYRPAADFFYYIPLPLDTMRRPAEEKRKPGESTSLALLIVASRNPANERSLKWFLNAVWPSVSKKGAHLKIVGGISKSFAADTFENVTFQGMVEDIAHSYRQADVVLLPITNGGGIAIKTLEAIQHGKPVVATRHALRGLPAAVHELLPGCHDEQDFVTDLSRLIASAAARKQRSEEIRQLQGILASIRFDEQMHSELDLMRATGRSAGGKREQAGQILPLRSGHSHSIPPAFQPNKAATGIKKPILRHVVVPPASPGSKGDEGMVRGCLSLLTNSAEIVVLNPEPAPQWNDIGLGEEFCRFKELAGPFSGFYNSITPDDVFIILGADVIDGTCGLEPSLERLKLVETALAAGASAHIFCSFRSQVSGEIIAELRQIQDAHFYLRDMHSLKRFKDQTRMEAEYFPDFFIYCPSKETTQCRIARKLLATAKSAGKTAVGLNFSEHAFRSFSDIHDLATRKKYVADILTSLSSAIKNPYFLLISNDTRHWNNFLSDSDYQNIAHAWLKENGYTSSVFLLNPDITYPEILNLLNELDMVVSGRMHLALAAFRNHVLPVCIMGTGKGYSSAEKMQGTFDKFIGRTELVASNMDELALAVTFILNHKLALKAKLEGSLQAIEKDSSEKKLRLQKRLRLDEDPESMIVSHLETQSDAMAREMENRLKTGSGSRLK